jgi:hypothetical protein
MKQNLLIACAVVMLSGHFAAAQESNEDAPKFDKQAFQAKRNAYITAAIGLTADEAAEFIPLDNELKQKQFEAGRECRRLNRESRSLETMTDAACLRLVECNIETRIKEVQLEKEYYEKFKHILSPVKLYKYQQADFRFMKEFMRGGEHHHKNDSPLPDKSKR